MNIVEVMRMLNNSLVEIQTFIGLATGVIIAGITAYRKIVKVKSEGKLFTVIAAAAGVAEHNSGLLNERLIDKSIDPLSNDGKAYIVASIALSMLKTKHPKVIRRLKLYSVGSLMPYVNVVYQADVKPIVDW